MAPFPFPDRALAWTFFALLVGLLAVAAVIDLRRAIVPKWLSLTTLALGVTCNLVRGAWLGSLGMPTWTLGGSGAVIGALDGLLFALAGFAVGFAIFFLMWIAGVCKGGDVKLFAAVSAWVGPFICLWILVLSTIILIALLALKFVALFLAQGFQAVPARQADKKSTSASALKTGAPNAGLPGEKRGPTYSLSVALATALALYWFIIYRSLP